MATVYHSGNIIADETWAASDEHHISANVSIGKSGASTRVVVTVEEGATIYFDGNFAICGISDITAFGAFVAVASSWENRIRIMVDPTIYPEPRAQSISRGVETLYDCDVTMRYVHGSYLSCGYKRYDRAGGISGHLDMQKCFLDRSNVFGMVEFLDGVSFAGSMIFKNNMGFACNNYHLFYSQGDQSCTFSGAWDVERQFIYTPMATPFLNNAPNIQNWPIIEIKEYVIDLSGTALYATNMYGHLASAASLPNFTDLYIAHGAANVLALDYGVDKVTLLGCVIWDCTGGLISTHITYHSDFEVKHCDFIENVSYAIQGEPAQGIGDITSSYFKSNRNYDCVEPGSAADENQYRDCEGTVTIAPTPNMPLEVDNISEGTPGTNDITITFDSASGLNSRRCFGSAFIKYSTSSGVYTEHTIHPKTWKERGFLWTEIDPQYGEFYKKTGHSVTINNLKAGTTYYYKCCFIDPLGRVAEGTEGSFTIESADAAGGGGGVPKLVTSRAGDTPVLG